MQPSSAPLRVVAVGCIHVGPSGAKGDLLMGPGVLGGGDGGGVGAGRHDSARQHADGRHLGPQGRHLRRPQARRCHPFLDSKLLLVTVGQQLSFIATNRMSESTVSCI